MEKTLKHELYKHGSYLISLKESGSEFVNIDDEIKKLEELFQLASKKGNPAFVVGEYYSFTTYRKDYDADTTFIFKASGTKNGGLRVLEYDIHGNFFGEYVYDTDSDFLKEAKPATAEQIATFQRAEHFAKYGDKSVKKTLTIPKYLNALALENHINFSQLLQKALREELQEVGEDMV